MARRLHSSGTNRHRKGQGIPQRTQSPAAAIEHANAIFEATRPWGEPGINKSFRARYDTSIDPGLLPRAAGAAAAGPHHARTGNARTKKKEHPTLLDSLVAEFNRREFAKAPWDARGFQKALLSARRFVLDDEMSAFSADLAWAPLSRAKSRGAAKKNAAMVDQMRQLARLPHSLMWIELNLTRRDERARHYADIEAADAVGDPEKMGWLLMQHPQIETAFLAINCISESIEDSELLGPGLAVCAEQWRSDDGPLAWAPLQGVPRTPADESPRSGRCEHPYSS